MTDQYLLWGVILYLHLTVIVTLSLHLARVALEEFRAAVVGFHLVIVFYNGQFVLVNCR